MRLNSTPSAANSSWPLVGTRVEKSPRPSRWAASRKLLDAPLQRLRRDDGERQREDEEADQDRDREQRASATRSSREDRRPRTAMRARAPWKSGAGLRAREPVAPADLDLAVARAGPPAWRRRASTRPRGRCAGRRPGRPSGAGSARRRRRPSWPRPRAGRRRARRRRAAAASPGRIAAGSPTSLTVARSRVQQDARGAVGARAARRGARAARPGRRRARAVATGGPARRGSRDAGRPGRRASCTRPADRPLLRGELRLALPVSLSLMQAEERRAHRHHRHEDDQPRRTA